MVKFYDISAWEEQRHYNTGGTRNKCVVINNEDNGIYFFKASYKKEVLDYEYEYWSEIIASQIGGYFGFDVLHYDVAVNNDKMGCLSKSMIDSKRNEALMEGYKLLIAYDQAYDIKNKSLYTFQLINKALKHGKFDYIHDIVKTIIFDSIIGNGDRHQENWSLIVSANHRYSQIYDNGSCLGREISEEKIPLFLLENSDKMKSYIRRGPSEIYWEGKFKKLNHYDLILKLMESGYKAEVEQEIKRVRGKFDEDKIRNIVIHIDNCLPNELEIHKIPKERKELIGLMQ